MFSSVSIRRKMVVGLLSGFLLFGVAIWLALSASIASGLSKYFSEEISLKSDILENEILAEKAKLAGILRWFATSEDARAVIAGMSRDDFATYAFRFHQSFGVDSLVFFDAGGKVLYGERTSVPDATVREALGGKDLTETIVEPAMISLRGVGPVYRDGKVVGGFVIEKQLGTASMVSSFSSIVKTDITFYSGDRRIQTTLTDATGKKAIGTTLENKEIRQLVLDGGETYRGRNMLNGRQYISVYKPIKTRDGTVAGMLFVGKTMDSIKDVSSRIFMTVVPGMAILTLVLLGCFVFLVRFVITNPLRKIGDAVHNLASGNADLTYRIGVSGGDEIGVIARDINTFMEMQQALMRDVLRAQKSLSEIGGMMSTHALSTADSVERIMTNVQDVRTLSGRQSASVRRTDGVVATSIASVGSLNSLIERQTVGITESSAAIEEMVGNIASVNASVQKMSSKFGELISTTEGGKTKLSDVDVRVSKIAEQSSMLMEANRVIAQIASQTNLLAMNAAIEAAHAGSAGAGFSVVADEIRKLAENSARQSKAINAELKRIFASIEDVVRSSSQSGLAFGEIVGRLGETDGLVREIADAMREQMAASTQILGALRDMNASSCDVLEESRKLGTGVRTVEAEMREVTGLTAGVSSNMDGIFSGLEEINASSRGVSVLAVATTDNIRAMGEISGKFLVE